MYFHLSSLVLFANVQLHALLLIHLVHVEVLLSNGLNTLQVKQTQVYLELKSVDLSVWFLFRNQARRKTILLLFKFRMQCRLLLNF